MREGERERARCLVSLRITGDTDLNINAERPYRALIIDYHRAFGARDVMCARKHQLRGYSSAADLRYGS